MKKNKAKDTIKLRLGEGNRRTKFREEDKLRGKGRTNSCRGKQWRNLKETSRKIGKVISQSNNK